MYNIKVDMIEVYKILTNKYDSRVNLYLEKQRDSITRGHCLKLVNNRYHNVLRKISFAPRIVDNGTACQKQQTLLKED